MGRFFLIDGLTAAVLLGIWYVWFMHYNHRKGTTVLRWVQSACADKGWLLESHWVGTSLLQAKLHLPSRWFGDARLTVRLLPRTIPAQWIISRWRKQKETLSFEADLDCAPAFQLDVFNHRWCGRSRRKNRSSEWNAYRPGPVVLTTREEWAHELTPVLNALVASQEKNFLSVRFCPDSPHFSATVALETLADQESAAAVLGVLRELAAGASAKQL